MVADRTRLRSRGLRLIAAAVQDSDASQFRWWLALAYARHDRANVAGAGFGVAGGDRAVISQSSRLTLVAAGVASVGVIAG